MRLRKCLVEYEQSSIGTRLDWMAPNPVSNEISDFTPYAHAQSIILLLQVKSGLPVSGWPLCCGAKFQKFGQNNTCVGPKIFVCPFGSILAYFENTLAPCKN